MSSWTDTTLTTYTGDAVTDMDLGAVNELEHFDDLDDPITLERREWVIVTVSTVIMHPRTELCTKCDGEGCNADHCTDCGDEYTDPCPRHASHISELPCDDGCCPTCEGDGTHPFAGQVEIVA